MKTLHQIRHRNRRKIEVADNDNSPQGAEKSKRYIKLVRTLIKRKILNLHALTPRDLEKPRRHAPQADHRYERRYRRIVYSRPIEPRNATVMRLHRRRISPCGDKRAPPVDDGENVIDERQCRDKTYRRQNKKKNSFFHSRSLRFHFVISMTAEAVRARSSGLYMASTETPGKAYFPAETTRTG